MPPLAFYFTTGVHFWSTSLSSQFATFVHWNDWVGSICFTNATKSDVALQDHVWCAQQLMGFQSSGPEIEVVCTKCPWNIFFCECLCLCHQLLWPSAPPLWRSSLCYCTLVLCGPRWTQLTLLPQAATEHPCPAVTSVYAVRINHLACLSTILMFSARTKEHVFGLLESRGSTLTFVVQPRGCLLGFLWK